MKVKRVALTNFLSYPVAKTEFAGGVNVITGENASGKTNLVDAVYYTSVGRSSRQNKDKELVNWDANGAGARITVQIEKKFSKHEVDIYIDPQGKKRVLIDRLPIQKIGELMGVLNVVFFSPSEMKLVKESPVDRRRFLDISLSQQSKVYFYTLQTYNKLLMQRNKILKMHKGKASLPNMLALTDPELCRTGAAIIAARRNFIEKLAPFAAEEHKGLTNGRETLTLLYETEAVAADDVEGSLKKLLADAAAMDTKLDFTTVGPHRDDLKIAANGIDLRKFGSQGQQRSAVLSLKLAEIRLMTERSGETPVLILDDVLSELDESRRAALFQAIQNVQSFITCTEAAEIPFQTDYKHFHIQDRAVHTVEDRKP